LKALKEVKSVAMSNTGATSGSSWGGDFEATVNNELVKGNTNIKFADEGYFETYGMKLIHGEGIIPSDTVNRFVVNEKFTKVMGYANPEEAIGTQVKVWENRSVITGIVKDFNAIPLRFNLSPVIILAGTSSYQLGAVRLETGNLKEGLREVQKVWESVYPNYVFEHTFLDDQIASFYDAERRTSSILNVFSATAIFIGAIGLFGLVSFIVQQRFKEIGIRKTFGATVSQIVSILSKEFLLLIGIAFMLAAPLALYFIQKWLSNFAYRYEITGIEFLAGLTLTLFVSMLTVGYRAVRAARANPIDALRSE
jgi:ABC-type antimicrobial peptide transport system permease subunit